MSTLPSQQYSNISRTVSGTPIVSPSDEILLCDTSIDVVTINLLDIPAGAWNSIYKLYVIDASNNAATKNITINAPSGYTINGSASVVINTNGGSALVRIVADTKYLAQLNIASGIGSQGIQGTQGIQGLIGSQGIQGTQGIQGLIGSQGIQGLQGIQGIQGLPGSFAGQGIQGIQGLQGLQGLKGDVGAGGVIGYYGTFYSFGTQSILVANTPQAVQFDLTYISNGVSVVSNSKITFAYEGTYLLVCNVTARDTAGGSGINFYTFFKKGGTNIARTMMSQALDAYPALVERQIEVTITSADILGGTNYVELFWTSDAITAIIDATPTPISPYNGPDGGSKWASVSQVTYSVQGLQGLQGIQGIQGVQGTQGVQGNFGTQGTQGLQGLQGLVGPVGAGGVVGYWGSFWDTTTQPLLSTTSEQIVTINTTDPNSNGVSIVSGSRMTFANAGVYSITFSVQITNSDNSNEQDANLWLRLNDSGSTGNIPDSDSKATIPKKHSGVNGAYIMTVNFVLKLNAGDYIELVFAGSSTQLSLTTTPAGTIPISPRIPSVILTATQVAYAIQGIQGIQGTQGVQGGGFNQAQGTQGVQGLIGLQGLQGVQGTQGVQGGFGTQGLQGTQGISNQGIQGTIGSQGIQGRQGTQGLQGISNQGIQGTIGIQGRQGTQGLQGGGFNQSQGIQGIQGPAGGGGGGTAWLLGGNAGITPTDYFGTTSGATINFVLTGNNWGTWQYDPSIVAFGKDVFATGSGTEVVAFGFEALRGNIGDNVIGIGYDAGRSNTGSHFIAIGEFAGYENIGARDVIAIGRNSAYQNQNPAVIAIGESAAYQNAYEQVLAIGYQSAYLNKTTAFLGIGELSGYNNSIAENLVCIGHGSAYQNSANDVVAFGNNALYGNSATQVVGIGLNAGFDSITPASNNLPNSFIVAQQYIPQYTDYINASAGINPGTGAVSGNYYFYYNTTTNSIDAVYVP
jgi:hypothetical protein